MQKTSKQTESINIRMTEVLCAGLDRIALKKGLSRTEFLRFLIQSAIEKDEADK